MGKKNCNIQNVTLEHLERYYCPAGDNASVTESEIKDVEDLNWNTFERFKLQAFNIWIVDMPVNKNWIESTCSCPQFFKGYICRHVVGQAIRLKLVTPPPAAKNIPIGQKRKRGRPKLASRALLVD